MGQLHHECGVAAVYQLTAGKDAFSNDHTPNEAAQLTVRMLQDIQNRGQLAAGLTSFGSARGQLIDTHKDVGSVSEVFRLSHTGKFKEPDGSLRRDRRHRPCPLRHLWQR